MYRRTIIMLWCLFFLSAGASCQAWISYSDTVQKSDKIVQDMIGLPGVEAQFDAAQKNRDDKDGSFQVYIPPDPSNPGRMFELIELSAASKQHKDRMRIFQIIAVTLLILNVAMHIDHSKQKGKEAV